MRNEKSSPRWARTSSPIAESMRSRILLGRMTAPSVRLTRRDRAADERHRDHARLELLAVAQVDDLGDVRGARGPGLALHRRRALDALLARAFRERGLD